MSKYQAGDVIRNFKAYMAKPEELTTEAVRTDEGGEFQVDF